MAVKFDNETNLKRIGEIPPASAVGFVGSSFSSTGCSDAVHASQMELMRVRFFDHLITAEEIEAEYRAFCRDLSGNGHHLELQGE